MLLILLSAFAVMIEVDTITNKILVKLEALKGEIMAGITDVNNSETTLHQDLVAENGLIKQLLSAFANGIGPGANAGGSDERGRCRRQEQCGGDHGSIASAIVRK